MVSLPYIKRLARFEYLRNGLTTFLQKSMVVREKTGCPLDKNWEACEPYEDSIEAIARSFDKKAQEASKNKLWVVAHFAKILKAFFDDGEFFEWCKGNQNIIAGATWEKLRKELALILNLLMELEVYSSKKERVNGARDNPSG